MSEKENNRTIEKIPEDVCRRICTGQVVSTLSSACKELIDNALDAGANTLEIRIRSFGCESIEVIDNGTGIHSSNFDVLGKAHATSKLNDITDFSRLSTFGFRGEALHALCAISSVVVTTRHIDETMATRMVFDHNGCIVSRESCARPAGTTVVVSNLFETLPVRRKELQRTAKKEFCKLLNVVQTFALSRTDIRFSIASTSNGKRQQVLSTPGGNATIKDVLVTLFGARSNKNAVLDIVQRLPNDQICILYGVDAEKSVPIFAEIKLSGYVSSCVHGHGRSSNDRQFIYFNRRPVHYPKLCRVANEVYQQYNQGYYCMLVLFVEVPPENIDVNVSPDKRCIFYEKERELFALLRASLLATFEPYLGQIQSVTASQKFSMTSSNDHSLNECTANVDSISVTSECDKLVEASKDGRTATLNDILHSTAVIPHHHGKNEGQPQTMVDGTRKRGAAKVLESFAFKVITHERKTDDDDTMLTAVKRNKPAAEVIDDFVANTANEDDLDESSSNTTLVRDRNASVPTTNPRVVTLLDGYQNHQSKMAPINIGQLHQIKSTKPASANSEASSQVMRTQQTVLFTMSSFKNRMSEMRHHQDHPSITKQSDKLIEYPVFNVTSQQKAEEELDAKLEKDDFASMNIIGQFNKGFIITQLHNDLFIVDQHASDEKFNFERLQSKARIQSQLLISPRVLNIGAMEEAILRDNIDIFNYNGYEFRYDEEGEPGQRFSLTSVPVLSNCQFNISDIHEMLSVLKQYPGIMYRPTKVHKLFASRACRTSVMIGTSLSLAQMQKIVRHLGELNHPWNCPHGRPTLRHLCSLSTNNSPEQIVHNPETHSL